MAQNLGKKHQFPYRLTGETPVGAHEDLGAVCRVADGRIGLIQNIGATWVGVGGAYDFGLWEATVFPKSDVRVIGVRT